MTVMPAIVHPLLEVSGSRHGFFTRRGGVSNGLYDSLNVGIGSSDDPGAVTENRRRIAEALGQPVDRLVTNYQVHSARVVPVDGGWSADEPRAEADALVTGEAGLVLGALTADCAPILLLDPEARVAAAVHAGWKGALAGVAEAAVATMQAAGADPARLRAVVGPCIGPDSYEVDLAFRDRFTAEHGEAHRFFREGADADHLMFDLPGFVLWRLAEAGVTQTAWTGHDTYADETRFFSNRRAFKRGETDFGRLMSAVVLED
ncbi:MAG TPA: peptidoglycan editing factor PgeF [Caulobacteraceae bacterium]